MEKKYKIGIDVGGTNTDAVLVDQEDKIIAKTKKATTADIFTGIEQVIQTVLKDAKVNAQEIQYVMLGTTHCTNAIVERKQLDKVGVIRICKPASEMIPPMFSFPEDLKAVLGNHISLVEGGFEFDGRLIRELNEAELKEVLQGMKGKVESLAITGIFSQINPDQELKVAALAKEVLGENIAVSLSHQIGSLGLLERENATILNAALHTVAVKMTKSFEQAVTANQIEAKLYFCQNDGTLMPVKKAEEFPVLTIASGPTNSIRGAGALSGVKDGIVIDVGGTTSDAGVLVNQFPRESNKAASVGGVQTNFRMPDVVAIGLGGGTIVNHENENLKVGPESVGYRIVEEALAFGGNTFTLSDYAILQNELVIENTISIAEIKEKLQNLSSQNVEDLQQKIKANIKEAVHQLIDKVKTTHEAVPLVMVGGGSPILPNEMEGVSEIIRPEHYEVANAYGASIAQVSGEAEKVFNLSNITREDAIEDVKKLAMNKAIHAGAKEEALEVLNIQDVPLAYLPNASKIKVKVCGDLEQV